MASLTFNADPFQNQRRDGVFKEYKPHVRGNAARITDDQWEPFFPLIRCLHNARRTRTQILEILREQGLEPSVAQLYAKMSKWGLRGYGPTLNKDNEALTATLSSDGSDDQAVQTVYANSCHSQSDDVSADSSEDSQVSSDSANCFSSHDVDTSDTVYDTEGPPAHLTCDDAMVLCSTEPMTTGVHSPEPDAVEPVALVDAMSTATDSTDSSSVRSNTRQRLPSDLMALLHSTGDISEFDKHDILNEVASFLCATGSFSDAFVLFDSSYTYLKNNQGTSLALVFATVNCLRSATFKEQCQYAGALMGEALASIRLLADTNPYTATALSSLEEIGRELCVKSELGYLSILYNQVQFYETSLSTGRPSTTSTNEILLHCSDPFLLAKANDQPEILTQSLEVSSIALGRLVGKLSQWASKALSDFNPIQMLPSAGFNPSDPVSVARFSTALSCHFIRKWSFASLAEVLAHCNELLPPNRKEAASRLCKLAVRVLSTLAVYTIYQATGTTLRDVSGDNLISVENQAQYVSPLASHLDMLSRLGNRERLVIFAAMHKTLYNRTLVYRQEMDDHCLTAYVRETGFLLAASLIRLRRELNTETVPRPATHHDISRTQTPIAVRDFDCLSRKSSDSSASMRNLARRNLLVPGMMSRNGPYVGRNSGSGSGSGLRRRFSTDSNESWNFTKVTGLPAAPSPPESVHDHIVQHCNDINNDEHDNQQHNNNHNDGHECNEMTGLDPFWVPEMTELDTFWGLDEMIL